MKRNKSKWYLVIDSNATRVANSTNIAEFRTLKVVIIEISAKQAAEILWVASAHKAD